ncbi:methionine synthase (B12-dependent) [Desulforamulus reducens MI-1]|uniref:Methionine synthase n=1 Tax=Desulforamulus reducens (strain ATCC BAA-1160 / DSM 100696 / MI-1) TaxID=349161 RepID=A4J6L9_DESRM|nr:homocysteine S-methyltransferase family protein [Desulforamulus reducens]ABO50722.1 methionine synthase (B12-dependent) [Desulforamulus reducens MI-1]
MSFRKRVKKEVLIIDGAMGTLLQQRGLPGGWCPEEWNLSHPEAVKEIHKLYLEAGADIITTNTFGAIQLKLADYHLGDQVKEINQAAVKLAKEVAQPYGAMVAGSVGPLGKFLQPLGTMTFEEAYQQFYEQCAAMVEAGVDLILFETFGDIGEMRAALIAAADAGDVPVVASFTFDETGRTFTGTDPETAAVVAERLGIAAIGVNCSVGPRQLEGVVRKLTESTNLPVLVSPNAGMPEIIGGKTVFRETPEIMAEYAQRFVDYGASILGGCCGTTPKHIQAIYQQVKKLKPKCRNKRFGLRVASRVKTVTIQPSGVPVAIGERLNPTGKKALQAEIREGKTEITRRDALTQVQAGAEILDVNVGVGGVDQVAAMERAVQAVQVLVEAPLCIDSTDPTVIEHALKLYHGKALINSVNGEENSIETILPLAKRYGAALIGLTLDDEGIPPTAAGRLAVARRLVERTEAMGIPRDDLMMDCLVLTVSAQPEGVPETLEAIRLVKQKLQITTSLGVSNVSFGLPNRVLINAAFFAMALNAGLDAAILNPQDQRMMETLRASAVLTGRDVRAEKYIAIEQQTHNGSKMETTGEQMKASTPLDILYQAVLSGDKDNIVSYINEALKTGLSPMELLDKALIPGIEEVGRRYGAGIYFLPQLMMAGETMTKSFERLRPELAKGPAKKAGTVVLATVKGDIHDIGKNIVSVMLANHGFEVIDLGKNVANEEILRVAAEQKANIIGLSALMTTTMVHMQEIIKLVKEQGLNCKVMVGGAAVTEHYAREIGADGYAIDAVEAVNVAKKLAS